MKLERARPDPVLREYVRCFEQREATIRVTPVVYPIAARPNQILEFYLQQSYIVRVCESAVQDLVPRAVVVGPSTHRRAELVLYGSFLVFTICFTPSGFHRLFRVPMRALVDRAYDAQSVIGSSALEMEERLAEVSDFPKRVSAATAFLLRRLTPRPLPDSVSLIANQFVSAPGAVRVGDAAFRAGLGIRQFERRFAECVGLPPKLYGAIVRFNAALEAKNKAPKRHWTDIAFEAGYYDQMHMVRDFARFSGESPGKFVGHFQEMSETWA